VRARKIYWHKHIIIQSVTIEGKNYPILIIYLFYVNKVAIHSHFRVICDCGRNATLGGYHNCTCQTDLNENPDLTISVCLEV
jgi:hypothetical protein